MENGATSGEATTSAAAAATVAAEESDMSSFGELLVNVRAQVMMWDDRYCGWLPLEGGGPSTIRLFQRAQNGSDNSTNGTIVETPSDQAATLGVPKFEYIVHGERLEDRKVNLHCQLSKDVNYRQVMPTFHHWQIDEEKFGLKFMSSYEACKFHNRFQKAVEHLYRQSKSSSGESYVEDEDLEDDVFMPVDLPLSRAESWESGSTGKSMAASVPGPSTSLLRTTFPSYSAMAVPAIVHQPSSLLSLSKKKKKSTASAMAVSSRETSDRPPGRTPTWPKTPAELTLSAGAAAAASTSKTTSAYPYVYFQKQSNAATAYLKSQQKAVSKAGLHASASFGQLSAYPSRSVSIGRASALEKRESIGSLKVSLIHQQITLPSTSSAGRYSSSSRKTTRSGTGASPLEMLRRERCFYCKAYYIERDNRRGACPDAPDPYAKWLRRLTCLWCAECVMYCCCSDWTDGEAPHESDVCSCSPEVPARSQRWALLTVLAMFVPCLWCYPPLAACHRTCRRRYRIFGGKHVPMASGSAGQSGGRASSACGRMSTTPEPSAIHK